MDTSGQYKYVCPLCLVMSIFCLFFSFTSHPAMEVIGQKIWMNECAGKVEGLTSWNKGESFASLGIGHFIWFPEGKNEVFEETFPKFIHFVKEKKLEVPCWAEGTCPWKNRDDFLADLQGERMQELRKFLVSTIPLQMAFMEERLLQAWPRISTRLTTEEKKEVEQKFQKILATPGGFYPLIDYINFKGEGVKSEESYNHQGWGLLQVLQMMENDNNPLQAFAKATAIILKRRVENSPPERHEERWLPGWLKRCESYGIRLQGT